MTKEQAIEIIRKEYLCVDRDCDIERSCGKCDLMIPTKEPILEALDMAIEALKQEPKTGHWKRIGKRGEYAYICSQCNHESMYKGNFCSNCGADMREKEKNNV